ncbi:hypothetical protein A4D02_12955 [Niastella koreensis]|uniref:Glycine zipper domain-containing protein n=2 Tax=Niastella koreensis TaxID=354356 RepID=G8TL24_NIAKG|nr:glycine zipper domain-containing protein [Niastella koreensis]AEW00863.1 hypothetical protein Niako_4605 [Niastella koreensis GR20-10]OQP42472.1 hypothetical protein A4D02_12955 [Niastella koreensis]
MKRILYTTTAVVVSAAMLISSCKNNDNKLESGSVTVAPDTISQKEYNDYKAWKEQHNAKATTPPAQTVVVHKHYTTVNETQPAAQPVKKKKGWSKAAKGTVIGAGVGAAAGAIIVKKNRGLGAAAGAVLGGGAGYGVGRSMDKKDGRVSQ